MRNITKFKNYREARVQNAISRLFKDPQLNDEQIEVLRDYYEFCCSSGSKMNSILSIQENLRVVVRFGRFLGKAFNLTTKKGHNKV